MCRAVQAKRQYLLTLQVSRYCLLHLKSSIVRYLLTLQEYSDPENPGLIWKNTMEVIAPLLTTLGMLCRNFKLIR